MHELTFCKDQRICDPALFKQILKSDSLNGRLCVIYYQLNQLKFSRIGIIASRHSIRFAVKRNSFKRLARESFRHQIFAKSCDFVIVARKKANLANKQEVRICLNQRWQELRQIFIT